MSDEGTVITKMSDEESIISSLKKKLAALRSRRVWTRDQAIELAVKLENHFAGVYHVALTGSVLTKGISKKDVDLIIYPHTNGEGRMYDIHEGLESFGMKLVVNLETIRKKWAKQGSIDTKMVEVWRYNSKRVDVFMPWINSN